MFKITLKFDLKKVQEAEDEYKKLTITPEQRQLIEQIAQMMQNLLPLSVMAIKGNTWYSIKEWQVNNKMKITEIAQINPHDRLKKAKELFLLGKERTCSMLANPEEQKHLIEEAYQKAWNIYEQYTKK